MRERDAPAPVVMRGWRAATFAVCIAGASVSPVGGAISTNVCAASEVHIAVVVDVGSGSSVSAVCVPAGARDNGAVVLATRAAMLGTPAPRYATSGLLCAIDGFPATGCGEPHNGRYSYWSYWHGSGGAWSYANIGPATSRVDPGVVEGWRWEQDASASPADPPPRVAPVATAICKPAAPPPPPTTTTIGTTPSVHAGGSQPPATAPRAGQDPRGSSGPAPARGSEATAATSSTGRRSSTGSTSSRRPRRTATSSSSVARGAGAAPSTTIALAAGGIAHLQHTSGSGGVPVGLVGGVVLVVALFAGGAVAARRRRSPA